MKIKRNFRSIAIALCMALVVSLIPGMAFADTFPNDYVEARNTLLNFGYSEAILDEMPMDIQFELSDQIKKDSDSIEMTEVILQVDAVKEIEKIKAMTDAELSEAGLTKEEIADCREQLKKFEVNSVEELCDEFGLSRAKCEVMKEAVVNTASKAKKIKKEDLAVSSGSISTSDLNYTHSVAKNSGTTSTKKVRHKVILAFAWLDPFIWCFNEDKIASTWGGNLDREDGSTNQVRYLPSKEFATATKHFSSYRKWSTTDTPNTGVKYSADQSISYTVNGKSYEGIIHSGTILFYVFQTKKQGLSTKIVSQYCHRTAAVTGVGISFSKNPISISVGAAWDTSKQGSTSIEY